MIITPMVLISPALQLWREGTYHARGSSRLSGIQRQRGRWLLSMTIARIKERARTNELGLTSLWWVSG